VCTRYRGRFIHLHADLGDFHGGRDDDLAGSSHAARQALEGDVAVGVDLAECADGSARFRRLVRTGMPMAGG